MESFTPEEDELLDKLFRAYFDENPIYEEEPLSNLQVLIKVLGWLCEEDAANLITAIRKVFPHACKPCECHS